jgi:hypothetical protein
METKAQRETLRQMSVNLVANHRMRQRLLIGEKDTTERGTKARMSIGGRSWGKESLMRGQSMAEGRSRREARARMIKSEWSWSTTYI